MYVSGQLLQQFFFYVGHCNKQFYSAKASLVVPFVEYKITLFVDKDWIAILDKHVKSNA